MFVPWASTIELGFRGGSHLMTGKMLIKSLTGEGRGFIRLLDIVQYEQKGDE